MKPEEGGRYWVCTRQELEDIGEAKKINDPWEAQLAGGSYWGPGDLKDMSRTRRNGQTKDWYLNGSARKMWPFWLRKIKKH